MNQQPKLDSLEQYQKDMARKRRYATLARAYLKRAEAAGIPERFVAIRKERLASLLSPEYHGDVVSFVNKIFANPLDLFKKPYIIIDGGDVESRKEAGYALLFRMISCDRVGFVDECSAIVHQFQTSLKVGFNHSAYADELKETDILSISECSARLFSAHLDTGGFLDEVLSYRYDRLKPTILSFSEGLTKKDNNLMSTTASRPGAYWGNYLTAISLLQYSSLRIRVRVNKDGRDNRE
ncbi:MAG: hypothetical protein WC375_08705 [Methanomassiliicoccales archaeon]|jgi:hypothetical protein